MESRVVSRLRRKRIATMKTVCDELDVSHMTVVRALKKYGYHNSVNCNASYYTLQGIPHFDEEGLWSYRDVCFSDHGSLGETLVALVEYAPAGLTVAELEQRVKTKVGNLLSRLYRQDALSRCFTGRRAAYLAVDSKREQQQRQERERQRHENQVTVATSDADQAAFPPHYNVVMVLEVLIQIIKTPEAEAAELAKALRTRGVKITAVQVQRVLNFYALQKKTEHWPSLIWHCG